MKNRNGLPVVIISNVRKVYSKATIFNKINKIINALVNRNVIQWTR